MLSENNGSFVLANSIGGRNYIMLLETLLGGGGSMPESVVD